MNFFSTPELKVGVMVVVVSGLIGVMSLKVAQGPGLLGRTKSYEFTVPDAGGLVKKSSVKMAGIKVGVVDDIVLDKNGKAHVLLELDPDTPVTTASKVFLKADGILGDKHVEIAPGDLNASPLPSDSTIPTTGSQGGVDDLMASAQKVAAKLNDLLTTLNKAAKEGDDSTEVGRIVKNLEKLTKDLSDITGRNKQKVNDIVDRLHSLTKNIDTYINEDSLASVDRSLKNIEQITDKLNRGDGTLGRLINDDQTVKKLDSAIDNVNKFLGGAEKMETSLDFHSEYLTDSDMTKTFVGVKIQPGLDRYYQLAVVDDPQGYKESESSVSTTNGGAPTTNEITKTFKNKLKFTAIFAKNFYDFTIKGGIIESAGGFGFDYHLLNHRLTLSTEFFDFRDMYIRAFARYTFFKGIYLTVGGDNLAGADNNPGSAFVGAGLLLTNDDLKTLAAKISL